MLSNTDTVKIYREPIKSQAAAYIREAILTGGLQPEERIVPSAIAKELNTGRGVIREALMQLESEGLVKTIPYRGSFVSKLNYDDLEEISTLRTMIESYAIRESVGKITEEDYHALYEICSNMQRSADQKKLYDVVRYDSDFHGYFVKKVSRSVLYEAWDITTGKMSNLFFSMFSRGYPLSQVAENHVKLIETLRVSPEEYLVMLDKHYKKIQIYK